jgi:hypothetical protein
MALGKAFIEVHADTKPFARELGRELNKILRDAEKDVRSGSANLGRTIAQETGRGIENNRRQLGQGMRRALDSVVDQGMFSRFAQGIVDSIDDGLSGLPAELKLALGAALAAILPFIGASITALVSATVVAAFAGLGFLVASQFEVVRNEFAALSGELRNFFVGMGNVFVQPVLSAFDMIRERVFALEGWFGEVFAASAQLIEPVTDAFVSFIEGLLPGLLDTLRNSQGIIQELVISARMLGRVIGEALRIISGSDDAAKGFRDLVTVFSILILSAAVFTRALTEIYGVARDIALLLSGPTGWAQFFGQEAAQAHADAVRNAANANGEFENSVRNLIAPTEAEEQALKQLNSQIDQLTGLMFATENNAIAFEQGIDDLTESIRENGRSLDIHRQAGRENANALLNLAQIALRTRADTIALTGDVNAAETAFQRQAAQIRQVASDMGLSEQATEDLIGELLRIPPPKATGVTPSSIVNLQKAVGLVRTLIGILPGLGLIGGALGAIPAYADGGVVTTPTVGLVGEAGPEAIIPLNNPARAAQVMSEAGLSGMMAPTVNVFIGNQQIDAYIDARVGQSMTTTARSLAYGGRGV